MLKKIKERMSNWLRLRPTRRIGRLVIANLFATIYFKKGFSQTPLDGGPTKYYRRLLGPFYWRLKQ